MTRDFVTSYYHRYALYKRILYKLCCCVWVMLLLVFMREYIAGQEINAQLERTQQKDGSVVFSVVNKEAVSLYIAMQFTMLKGLTPDKDTPIIIPLRVGKNAKILLLHPKKNAREHAYRISYYFLFMNPAEVQPDGFLYYLPFAHGVKHSITQGWNGVFSHNGQNTYAVDFDMAKGEKIYAARDGTVISIKEDSRIGGTSPQYEKHANYVLIRHADNTIASYVHLINNGAVVSVGDSVVTGQHIGYVGATGFASGPHLHFDVRVATAKQGMQSIPFHFRNKDGLAVKPQMHATYYGRFPEGKDFTELHGSDITPNTFLSYSKDISDTVTFDGLRIRKDSYDSVIVLFIANSFSYPVEANITLTLRNLSIEKSMPIKKVIPARKEVFLAITRVQNTEKSIALRSSIRYRKMQ